MISKIKKTFTELKEDSKNELLETKEVLKLLWMLRTGKKLTVEEKEKIKDQSLDFLRLLFLTVTFAIPGSTILLIVLVAGGKKVGIRLLPSSFVKKDVYEEYTKEWLKENPPFSGPYTEKMLSKKEFYDTGIIERNFRKNND